MIPSPAVVRASNRKMGAAHMLALGACVLGLVNLYRQRAYLVDDEYIELRYVRNLIEWHQPVWNRGEWVEGFTSPLHLLLLGAMGTLHVPLTSASLLLNCAALALLLPGCAFAFSQIRKATRVDRVLAWLLLAASSPLAIWFWGGLETLLTAAWISWAFGFAMAGVNEAEPSRARARLVASGIFYALAVATRPDSIAAALGCAVGVVAATPAWTSRQRLMAAGTLLLPVLLMQVGITSARWLIYGELAPNTYYAKVYGVPLLNRLRMGVHYLRFAVLDVAILPTLAVILACQPRLLREPLIALAGLTLATSLAGVWWVGGDWMPGARFLVPVLPVCAILFLGVTSSITRQTWLWIVLIAGVALSVVQSLYRPALTIDGAEWTGQLVGEYMERNWKPHSLIALNTAGAPTYFAPDMEFIDMLGIADKQIARTPMKPLTTAHVRLPPGHNKGNGAYVLGRQPDYIIAGFAAGQSAEASTFFGDLELSQSAEFARCYTLERVPIDYDEAYGRILSPSVVGPLLFTYYRRTCPVQRTNLTGS